MTSPSYAIFASVSSTFVGNFCFDPLIKTRHLVLWLTILCLKRASINAENFSLFFRSLRLFSYFLALESSYSRLLIYSSKAVNFSIGSASAYTCTKCFVYSIVAVISDQRVSIVIFLSASNACLSYSTLLWVYWRFVSLSYSPSLSM